MFVNLVLIPESKKLNEIINLLRWASARNKGLIVSKQFPGNSKMHRTGCHVGEQAPAAFHSAAALANK